MSYVGKLTEKNPNCGVAVHTSFVGLNDFQMF